MFVLKKWKRLAIERGAALSEAQSAIDELHRALDEQLRQFDEQAAALEALNAKAAPRKRAPCNKKAVASLTAFDFWSAHSSAVEAIGAKYGCAWKVAAPFGETVIANVPAKFRSGKTARGTIIRWPEDHRIPAAQYWPDGRIPSGLEIGADYPRDSAEHSSADRPDEWYAARGLIKRGDVWIDASEARVLAARDEQIAVNAALRAETALAALQTEAEDAEFAEAA